ncbi:MAG: hypothetical protein O3A29_06935 [Planctomycetota bacterium]|nr:hypothetical protein [Planctomycetota bacterium]
MMLKTATWTLCLLAISSASLMGGERNFLLAGRDFGGPILGAPVFFGQSDPLLGPEASAQAPLDGPMIEGPIPDPYMPADPGMASGAAVPLYHNVQYKDVCRISPCSVPKIVAVRDPCWRKDRCDRCAQPPCVYVQICVPNCGCERVRCSLDGKRVVYDYGKYSVSVWSRGGRVIVNYDKGLL